MKSFLRRILLLLKPHAVPYVVGQLAMIVVTVSGLAFPLAIRGIFDGAFGANGGDRSMLLPFIVMLAGVFLVKEGAAFVKNLLLGRIGLQVTARLRQDAYERLTRIPMSRFDRQGSGHWLSILTNDITQFQNILSGGLSFLFQSVLSLLGVALLLFRLDIPLSMSLLTLLPAAFFVTRRLGAKLEGISTVVQEKMGSLTTVMSETVGGIDVIRNFTLEREASGLFQQENGIVEDKSKQAVGVRARTSLANGLLNALYLLVITGFGAYRVSRGFMTPGDLIAFLLYTEMIYGPVLSLSELYMEIRRSTASIRRVFSLMDAGADPAQAFLPALAAQQDVPVQSQAPYALSFDHVRFGYGEKTVLEDVSFQVRPGETLALIGESGVGKSTLLKLIPRLYEATSGQIRINGIDIRQADPAIIRNMVASVPQHTHLFSLSIRDNIACGRPEATDSEIEQAARLANAHDFIMETENGYHTVLGENGAGLSGGQRQRIAIARAFVRNPRILLLDEATASLDATSEESVLQALRQLMAGRTTLIAAHRRTTLEGADRVLVLERGGIGALGTHASLLRESETYRRLMSGMDRAHHGLIPSASS